MGGNDDSTARPRWGEKHIGTVEEHPAGPCFGMHRLLIGWLGQAGLHLWAIKESIVLAPRDPPQSTPRQIRHHRPIAILPIQSHDPPIPWDVLTGQVRSNHLGGTQEFPTIVSVASPREGSHPLLGVGLQDGGARADHLTTLASQMTRRADLF